MLFNILAKGYLKQLSVLFGLVVGYIVALFMGKVDLTALEGVALVSLPQVMPYKPVFNLSAIVSVAMIFLVSATETIGDTSAMTNTVLNREASEKEISGSLACDGLVSSLSACFGCLPITSFSQNVGLLAMTKVVNRYTIAALSLSIGLGFTQVPEMFNIFPSLIRTIFAENCVAVVFFVRCDHESDHAQGEPYIIWDGSIGSAHTWI